MYFRNLVLSAFFIAIVVGGIFSTYQAIFITPIIVSSEVYEVAEVMTNHTETEAWPPEDGLERHSWSFATNFLLCFAYALILLSAMTTKTSINTIKGFSWGGAAYISIFAAPAVQ